jgi:chromosome segregation ATPase
MSGKTSATKIPVKSSQWTGQEDPLEELKKKHKNLKHHYQVMLEEKVRIKSDRDLFRGECEKLHSLCENLRKDKNQLLQELDQCRLQLRQGGGRDDPRLEQLTQQLRGVMREKEELEKSLQNYFEDAEHAKEDRNKLKYKFSEVQREKDRIAEKLRNVNIGLDLAKKEISQLTHQRDQLEQQIKDSGHTPHGNHQDSPHPPNGILDHSKVIEEHLARIRQLQEQNQALESALKDKEASPNTRRHLGFRSVSSGGLVKNGKEKGGSSPDLNTLSNRHDNLVKHTHTKTTHSLSSSANSLEPDNSAHLAQVCSKLKEQLLEANRTLQDTRVENFHLSNQMQAMTKEIEEITSEMDNLRTQLEEKSKEFGECNDQMRILQREKSVAMREHSSVYEELQQLKSEVSELKAEKEVVANERDINSQHRDKMMSKHVELKKKLDAIIHQRSLDARELSSMKNKLDTSLEDLESTRKTMEEIASARDRAEQDLHQVRSALSRSKLRHGIRRDSPSSPLSTWEEVSMLVESLANSEMMKSALLERLFQDQPSTDVDSLTVEEAEGKLDELLGSIHCLKSELKNKGQTSGGFHDQEWSSDELSVLNTRLTGVLGEKRKLLDEIRLLDKENQSLRAKHDKIVEEHAKTLERVDDLWKQKWKINWDEAWEEKRVSFQLDPDGRAGFAIMGGRDQSQLPNPNAIIVTQVNQSSPAEGWLRVGDVIETVNGINLSNVEHREAKKAVKDCNGTVTMLIRRRTCPQSGVESVLHAVGKSPKPQQQVSMDTQLENHEFSIMVGRDGLGFKWSWESVFRVSEVSRINVCDEILRMGDRILKVRT